MGLEAQSLSEVHVVTILRTDGPTLAQYVAAGYPAASYPPHGYAKRDEQTYSSPGAHKPRVGPSLKPVSVATARKPAAQKPAAQKPAPIIVGSYAAGIDGLV